VCVTVRTDLNTMKPLAVFTRLIRWMDRTNYKVGMSQLMILKAYNSVRGVSHHDLLSREGKYSPPSRRKSLRRDGSSGAVQGECVLSDRLEGCYWWEI
jgi:hypothetical protein